MQRCVPHLLNTYLGETVKKMNVKRTTARRRRKSVSPEILIGLRYVVNQCVSDYVRYMHTVGNYMGRRDKQTTYSFFSLKLKVIEKKPK